jgi:cell division protein FtsQ
VVALPVPRSPVPALLRNAGALLPSTRSLAAGFALLAVAAGVYVVARQSSMFAIRTVEVRGASPETAWAVRRALAPLDGTSLLSLGDDDVARRAGAIPTVVSVTYDRSFPHTLRVTITEERPTAVLRRGTDAFLVSARARVMRRLAPRTLLGLPRVWVARSTDVQIGATLAGDAATAVRALVPLSRVGLPVRVASSQAAGGDLSFSLRDGIVLRLGASQDLLLKLAIARKILPVVSPVTGTYLDVSVPDRPVSGVDNPKVGG